MAFGLLLYYLGNLFQKPQCRVMRALLLNTLCRFILFCCLCQNVGAVVLPNRDMQGWLNYTMTGSVNKSFRYWLETQERGGDNLSRFSQGLLRPGIGYTLNPDWSVWFGYAWVYTAAPFIAPPVYENRLWQQALWGKQIGKNHYVARTRLEERFIQRSPNTGFRLRQLFKTKRPMKHAPRWSVVASDEMFIHINRYNFNTAQGFDQNRLFIGFGYRIEKYAHVEFGYLNQYIKRSNGAVFLANIASINFLVNWP